MSQKRGIIDPFLIVVIIALVGAIFFFGSKVNTAKPFVSATPSLTPQNVLGENQEAKKVLAACSSGGLTTSTNKVFQMMYSNETFLQLTNTDLLKDVSQLEDLTCLQYLDATDRTVKGDIANLKNLTNLEVFSLYSNPDVSGDICSLSGATKLRSLKFAFDPKITGDVACLKSLTKLETFAMTHTQISGDISVFANMPNLKAIYVGGTNIKGDICSLSKLTNLEELGIADEYPGNPDITGDLSCLDNLQKLKRVSIYNTSTTNCEQFTKSHPDLAKTKTESGKQGGGGCSKESMKTLVDYAQKYEKKIGKDVQTEVRGQPNYNKDVSGTGGSNRLTKGPESRNFLTKIFDWVRSLVDGLPLVGNYNRVGPQAGPGGCKTQAACDAFCDKSENKGECAKFAPPGSTSGGGEGEVRPDLEKGGPGGCKSRAECEVYCSKPQNSEECSKFAPSGEKR